MIDSPLLEIKNLQVFPTLGLRPAVNNISLTVNKGEVLALIGESGSGKTTLALSALGHIRSGLVARNGTVTLDGVDMFHVNKRRLRSMRGSVVSYIAQSAAMSFNQRMRLDKQVTEPALIHHLMSSVDAVARAHNLYRELDLPAPDTIGSRYPHQVSGGQLQRFMIAMGLLLHPKLVVCDEPTSALDVTTQVEVLRALKGVIRAKQTAALFVSHDLAVVTQIADRIAVLRKGELIEVGTTAEIIENPQHPYTKQLIAACSRWPVTSLPSSSRATNTSANYLEVTDLWAGYGATDAKGMPAIPVLKGLSFALKQGQVLAIIGESGSGKSTMASVIAGLLPRAAGNLRVGGEVLQSRIVSRTPEQLRRVQMVFQSADTALNAKHTIGRILERVLKFFGHVKPADRPARVKALLEMVNLPEHYASRKPGQLSGGEKQRVNLARALAAEPDVLLCDEITSALDTVVAASILTLIKDLRDRLNLAIVFISHDMATVASLADQIMVLQNGNAVEQGSAADVLLNPQHAYTKLLLRSVPELRRGWLEEVRPDHDDRVVVA
ncbi:ABC transporter ATP-binding protein [Pusillimonas sp. ANT_WB101]|uniref:ABC transporter ATP-binding protein n=1 Tax=Pusillimonas sp. ANT_WB101 TaxID=2597356 RepID=UPI0011EFFF32|nr:ABC transporter ATP-binding protein [Pusillimonas sp. ANT_WB101]KAA0911275.1 ABC transporter ATP-binding protein [Pusillimonas sp. ANT_WB101]